MIPKGAIYNPLHVYLRTLSGEEWGRHIYAYFDDPKHITLEDGTEVKGRHTNAKLEGFNKIVKEINAAARGLSWEELQAKILYGDLAVKQKPRKFPRIERVPKVPDKCMAMECMALALPYLHHCSDTSIPSPEPWVWDTLFSIPVLKASIVKRWPHYAGLSTAELIEEAARNDNLRGSLAYIMDKEYVLAGCPDEVSPDDDSDSQYEEYTVIRPLRFSDWEANKDKYLAIIAADAQFLHNLKYKECSLQ